MMTLLSAFVLTLGASAGPAAAVPVDLLGAPQDLAGVVACSPSAAPVEMARGGGGDPGVGAQAFCQADCTEGADVSCSGGSCSAVNQNCGAGVQGYVQCDGQYQYCPTCQGGGGGGGCQSLFECRQFCPNCPGCIKVCTDMQSCSCQCECY